MHQIRQSLFGHGSNYFHDGKKIMVRTHGDRYPSKGAWTVACRWVGGEEGAKKQARGRVLAAGLGRFSPDAWPTASAVSQPRGRPVGL